MEILEIVDNNGNIIGTAPRNVAHGDNTLLHRVVHALVFDDTNKLLLQKRSMNKDVAAGLWDTSVGGHVDLGETTIEAICREINEELGINCPNPEFLYSYIHSNDFESELVYTYKYINNEKIIFNREEIDDVCYWDINELMNVLDNGSFSDNFIHELRLYLKHHQVLY
ncbi:MAG: NUDIX domain-containing protein [Nitrospirae bacterium]|nr:NUDIX domain-containing protein [Nitrospirota bacterium]